MSSLKASLTTNYSCYGACYNKIASHIIATTRNDHLLSYSLNSISKADDPLDISPTKKVHHRNFVNRFVTPFTAQPHAKFESDFLIGSSNYPREVKKNNFSFSNQEKKLLFFFVFSYLDYNYR